MPQGIDPEIRQAYEAYRNAPDDVAAYAHLMQTATERGKREAVKEVLSELGKRAQQQQTRHQVERARSGVASAVNATLKQHFPDVNQQIFWRVAAPQAVQETPPEVTGFAERLQWQVERAAQITRELQNSFAGPVQQATEEANAIRQGAAAVMPGGGSARPAQSASATSPVGWQDQMRATRERAGLV
jgi:hypothetical protein